MRAAVIQSMLLSAGHLSAPSSLQAMNQDPASLAVPAITPEEFDELDLILDDLRSRHDETPQWEFCEGFMAALMATSYRGPVCIEVEDPTFGKTLAGRQDALRVAGNVLRPYCVG